MEEEQKKHYFQFNFYRKNTYFFQSFCSSTVFSFVKSEFRLISRNIFVTMSWLSLLWKTKPKKELNVTKTAVTRAASLSLPKSIVPYFSPRPYIVVILVSVIFNFVSPYTLLILARYAGIRSITNAALSSSLYRSHHNCTTRNGWGSLKHFTEWIVFRGTHIP